MANKSPSVRVVDLAEPEAVAAAADRAREDLYPEAAAPAGAEAPAPAPEVPAAPAFDFEAERANRLDFLRAALRAPLVLLETTDPRVAALVRGAFRRADKMAEGLADRLTASAQRAIAGGKEYDAERWAWLGLAGALLCEVLQSAGEEKLAAPPRQPPASPSPTSGPLSFGDKAADVSDAEPAE